MRLYKTCTSASFYIFVLQTLSKIVHVLFVQILYSICTSRWLPAAYEVREAEQEREAAKEHQVDYGGDGGSKPLKDHVGDA
jgi:hypothetical protein